MVKSFREAQQATRAGAQSANHPLAGRKILFVDDDPDLRSVFERSFRYTGAAIDVADSPRKAITMALATDYCVVVTDLQMPGMTGVELVEALWQQDPSTAFILVTGAMELDLPTASASARAISSMVRKPWLPKHIDLALVQALELHDRRRDLAAQSIKQECMRVLIVEDANAPSGQIEALLAEQPNLKVIINRAQRLSSGMQALRTGKHDIILSDLSLPDARGLDAVAGLQRVAPNLPIVVMSGMHDEELAVQAVKAGAQDYLVKDELTRESLLRTLRYAIERKNTEEHVAYLQHHDHLTGLANRALFVRRASAALGQASSRNTKPAVLLLDLDHFKNINDSLGHSIGDLLLQEVAERLKSCVPNDDCLARLGGDEFAVLLEQGQNHDEASGLAQSMLDALKTMFVIERHSISISGSVGITVFPENGRQTEQLLANADAAMYRAKGAGRSRYQFFDQEMHVKAMRWMELERELRGALERDEFSLHYQPQIDCNTGKLVCFEALLRWTHHTMGPIGPFHFIPVLEDIGIIDKVGAWVTREACKQLAKWRVHDPDLRMAVNVSAIQFEDPRLADIVTEALQDAGVPPEALELEITEGLLMKDFDLTLATLERLSSLGIRIAIDDFGTGYSNLSYLARFPIDQLKVDKSITDMLGSPEGNAIANAVVQLGHALHIEVLAEGVETEAQLQFLKKAQVDSYQGYLYSKPITAQDMDALLASNPRDRMSLKPTCAANSSACRTSDA